MSGPILLLGGMGQVGWELQRTLAALGSLTAPTRAELDVTNLGKVREFIRECGPAIIVNAAGHTAVDAAEEEEASAMRLNAELPALLADEAGRGGIPLIHYSTDYVFDGAPLNDADGEPRGYRETDPARPVSVYGRSKLAGEIAVADSKASCLVFRTAWVYSTRRQNFLRTIQRLAAERDELRVVDDQIGAPTWARQIAETTAAVLARCWNGATTKPPVRSLADVSGVYHLTAAGRTSWHGFADAIVSRRGKRPEKKSPTRLVAIATSEYPTPAKRPAWSVLDNFKLNKTFGIVAPDWRSQLDLCLDECP